MREVANRLRAAILLKFEILLVQVAHDRSLLIAHHSQNVDHLDVHGDGRTLRLPFRRLPGPQGLTRSEEERRHQKHKKKRFQRQQLARKSVRTKLRRLLHRFFRHRICSSSSVMGAIPDFVTHLLPAWMEKRGEGVVCPPPPPRAGKEMMGRHDSRPSGSFDGAGLWYNLYIEMFHCPHATVSPIQVPNTTWWELERRHDPGD